jgi:hypothetical protein
MKCRLWQGAATISLVLATLSAGCTGTTSAQGTATVPPGSTPTTIDPWAVPATIDVAYLQRVMDRLDQSLGDALREMASAKAVDSRVGQILDALYVGEELTRTRQAFDVAASHLDKYQLAPGGPVTSIKTILSATAECAYFAATRSFAAAFINTPPAKDSRAFVALSRAGSARSSLNPTRWVLVLDALSPTGSTPKDPCP